MDKRLSAFAYHTLNPFGGIPHEVFSQLIVDGQFQWGALYRLPAISGIETLPSQQISVPPIKSLHVSIFPDGTSYLDLDESGKTIDREIKLPCLRVIIGTGTADIREAVTVGRERLREGEAIVCMCLGGIPLVERLYEGFLAPGSAPGRHSELVARTRAVIKNFGESDWQTLREKLASVNENELSLGVRRGLSWFQSAYWDYDGPSRFTKHFLAALAIIEWWADVNPDEIPPKEDGTKNDAPRAKVRAYLNVRLDLGDKTEPIFKCFERLYSARMRVFKAALRDSLTDELRKDALHFALGLIDNYIPQITAAVRCRDAKK